MTKYEPDVLSKDYQAGKAEGMKIGEENKHILADEAWTNGRVIGLAEGRRLEREENIKQDEELCNPENLCEGCKEIQKPAKLEMLEWFEKIISKLWDNIGIRQYNYTLDEFHKELADKKKSIESD